jgi:hypothetical protein
MNATKVGTAAALAAGIGAAMLLLRPAPAPPPPAPPPILPVDLPPPKPREEPPPGPAVEPDLPGEPAEEIGAVEAPLPPGAWPFDPPTGWREAMAALRGAEFTVDGTPETVADLLRRIGATAGIEVRPAKAIEGWAAETLIAPLAGTVPGAVECLEEIEGRCNLERLPGPDGSVELHARGRGPDTRAARAARAFLAFDRARRELAAAEAAGRPREPDPLAAEFRGQAFAAAGLDGLTLRDAAGRIEKALGVPVLLDRGPWDANPVLRIDPAKVRTAGDLAEALAAQARCEADAGPRGIVLFGR